MNIIGAILIVLFVLMLMFLSATWGSFIGIQLAVDKTKLHGSFKAYGKEWKAVEVSITGGES